jgi:drug/metabolite transporter (DMT)-like permease
MESEVKGKVIAECFLFPLVPNSSHLQCEDEKIIGMTELTLQKEPSKALIFTAFAGLYIIWGSTYLGIKYAIETIPPFLLVAIRFLIAGSVLIAWCIYKGEKLPTGKAFATIGFGGVLMLFVGNGAVSWAEQYLPSGLVAIIVATVPLWFVVLDKRQWNYYFSNKQILLGIIIGFLGVFMLFAGKGSISLTGSTINIISFFVLIIGAMGWAVGSLYSKYKKVEGSTTMKAAVQMLAAGIFGLVVSFISEEPQTFQFTKITGTSIIAVAYLIVFGSLVGYLSYIWLLSVQPPSIVGTYAYVNPVVAVFLGWLFLHEAFTSSQVFALLIILVGVILVNFRKDQKRANVGEIT